MFKDILKKWDEPKAGRERRAYRTCMRLAQELTKHAGENQFFPIHFGDKEPAVAIAATKDENSVCVVVMPDDMRTLFFVRREGRVGRQRTAEIKARNAKHCVEQIAAVVLSLDSIAELLDSNDESMDMCDLQWTLMAVAPKQGEPPDDQDLPKGSSNISPELEDRIRKSLAEHLAKEREEEPTRKDEGE